VIGLGSLRRPAFLAEKVLGNVVSSGGKVLVLAVMIDAGSTIFGQFARGFNSPSPTDAALTLILAAVVLLGLSILEPLRIVSIVGRSAGSL
jgi:type IV secretion system protein TrbL